MRRPIVTLLSVLMCGLLTLGTAGCATTGSGGPLEASNEKPATYVDPWEAISDRLDALPAASWQARAEVGRGYPYHDDGTVLIKAGLLHEVLLGEELEALNFVRTRGPDEFTVVLLRYDNETSHDMLLGRDASISLVDARGNSYTPLDPDTLLKDVAISASIVFRTPGPLLGFVYPGARVYVCHVFPVLKAEAKQLNIADWAAGGNYEAVLKFRR